MKYFVNVFTRRLDIKDPQYQKLLRRLIALECRVINSSQIYVRNSRDESSQVYCVASLDWRDSRGYWGSSIIYV
jgi:hypothetical protein